MIVPMDIVSDIFIQLPTKSLLRFRCISKPCCSLIDTQPFINQQLNHSLNTNSNMALILKSLYIYSVPLLDNPNTNNNNAHLLHDIPFEFAGGTEAFGSSNGLVAFRNSDKDNLLYNPTTKKLFRIPYLVADVATAAYAFHGFGFDSVSNDYKILRIATYVGNARIDVNLFSLADNSWIRISNADVPAYLRFMFEFYYHLLHGRGYAVFSNNVLHWIMPIKVELGILLPFIVAFNLTSHTFSQLTLPNLRSQSSDFFPQIDLAVLSGSLCLVCNYSQVFVDVWMMKEYGVISSWTKLFTIQRPKTVRDFSFLRPLTYSKNCEDKVLLELNSDKLVWYDLERKKFNTLRIDGAPDSFVSMPYVSSLVPLREDDVSLNLQKEQEQSRQQCRKKRDDFLSVGFKLVL